MNKTQTEISRGLIIFIITFPSILTCSHEVQIKPLYTFEIINEYPHDPEAFTEGLAYNQGYLYESTGIYGKSSLRKVKLETGEIIQKHNLSTQYFGEGIAISQNLIFQLTWKERIGFVYDKDTLEILEEFTYPTEGWGLTSDGENLILSDGTSSLYFLNPATWKEVKRIKVRENGREISGINELEYVNGEIFANIWPTDSIAIISIDGQITGWINLEGILSNDTTRKKTDVLNGIAYDSKNKRLFITGKLWPKVFEIKLIPIKD